MAFALVLSGCATASKTSPVSQLQVQVAEMQTRMEDHEKEIVDLKYEVKEMTSKLEEQETEPAADESATSVESGPAKVLEPKGLDIIRVGISGRELQRALKAAGVYEGKVDGMVGPRTKASVVEFQKAHSLKADGVVGQKTWSELKVYLNPSAGASEKAPVKE
jgi:peptidoglycan hydrolase-like protein with peptidoglycan-binding domain